MTKGLASVTVALANVTKGTVPLVTFSWENVTMGTVPFVTLRCLHSEAPAVGRQLLCRLFKGLSQEAALRILVKVRILKNAGAMVCLRNHQKLLLGTAGIKIILCHP